VNIAKEQEIQASAHKKHAMKERENAALHKVQAEHDKAQAAVQKKQIEAMISDLINSGVIKDENELSSIELSEKELLVNGKKQSDELHKRFKERYIGEGKTKLRYTSNSNSKHFSID
jgi:hypothetical protein